MEKTPDFKKPTENVRNFQVPVSTILKLTAAALIGLAIWHLWDYVMLLFVAMLVAVALDPLVDRFRRIPFTKVVMPRFVGIAIVALGTGALFAVLALVAAPTMVDQITSMVQSLPSAVDKLLGESTLPYAHQLKTTLHNFTAGKGASPISGVGDMTPWMARLFAVGQVAAGSISSVLLIYVFTLYFLIEGRETYEWIADFYDGEVRAKLDKTAETLKPVISAFVVGQLICSVLCAIYAFATLSLLHVPAALMLAVLAGLFDILPIIGVIAFTALAAIMASTVSLATAGIVVGLYLAYHIFEAYILLPIIYGSKLRLSGLVVLLSILVGASLGGIIGAIAILPVVASYPAIEKIWLRRQLGQGVIDRHAPVEKEVDVAANDSAAHLARPVGETGLTVDDVEPFVTPVAVSKSSFSQNILSN